MTKRLSVMLMVVCTVLIMAFALSGNVKAESLSMQEVTTPGPVADGKLRAATTATIDSLSYSSITIAFNDTTYTKEIQLFNVSGQLVGTTTAVRYGFFFNLSKNKVYSFRFREKAYVNGGYVYSGWSGRLGFCTLKMKVKLAKGRKVKYKVAKVPGVKKFKVYMSKNAYSKFKKVKTVKPGKSFKISKFRKKKFKKYTTYYYRTNAVLKKGGTVVCPGGSWYIY